MEKKDLIDVSQLNWMSAWLVTERDYTCWGWVGILLLPVTVLRDVSLLLIAALFQNDPMARISQNLAKSVRIEKVKELLALVIKGQILYNILFCLKKLSQHKWGI